MLPPRVPRLRVAAWPTWRSACAAAARAPPRAASAARRPGASWRRARGAVRAIPRERVDAADVHERRRAREAQVEHRHETLPAGQHRRLVAELREHRDRLLDGLGGVVGEGGGLHGGASLPAGPGRVRENHGPCRAPGSRGPSSGVGAAVLWSAVGIERRGAATCAGASCSARGSSSSGSRVSPSRASSSEPGRRSTPRRRRRSRSRA